jgi:O-antigen/teichoic acid export membrane protein
MNFAWSSGRQRSAVAASCEPAAASRDYPDQNQHSRSDHDHARGVYPLYFLANIASRASMLVVLIVLTRLLPTAEYGLFALVVTVGEMLEMGSSNWVRVYLLRTEAGAGKMRARQLGRALVLSAGGAAAALLTSILVAPFISADRVGEMMLAVAVYIAAFAVLRTTLTFAQLSRSHIPYAAIETGRALLIVTSTIIAAVIYPNSFLPASLALSLATGTCAVLGLLAAKRLRARLAFPRGGYLAALAFGVPFLLANCLAYAIGWSDRFVLNYFLGPAAVGVYVAAYSIARQPVELFVGALNAFTFPLLVRAYATDGSHKAGPIQSGLMVTIATLGLGIVAGLALLAEPLATLLFPPDYRADVVILIPWIAMATFILSIKQFIFDNGLHVTQQNWPHLFTMMTSSDQHRTWHFSGPQPRNIRCGDQLCRSGDGGHARQRDFLIPRSVVCDPLAQSREGGVERAHCHIGHVVADPSLRLGCHRDSDRRRDRLLHRLRCSSDRIRILFMANDGNAVGAVAKAHSGGQNFLKQRHVARCNCWRGEIVCARETRSGIAGLIQRPRDGGA